MLVIYTRESDANAHVVTVHVVNHSDVLILQSTIQNPHPVLEASLLLRYVLNVLWYDCGTVDQVECHRMVVNLLLSISEVQVVLNTIYHVHDLK